jgi:hypothetical protein
MKLFEKKCPNCGAQMSFKKDDKEVTCGYCRKSFIIENDNPEGVFDVESFKLINNTMGIMSGMHFVIFGIALFMIVGISVAMFNNIKNNKINNNPQPIINNGGTKNNTEKDSNYLTKYSEIGQDLIDLNREGGINALDNTINFYVEHFMPKIVNSWEYVGSYFLVRNETSSRMQHNILYDIYSITYKIDGENKTYYGVVVNSDFMRSGDKIVTLGNTLPAVPRNDLKDGKIAFGYISLDSVFNELVGKNIDFTIETNTFEG